VDVLLEGASFLSGQHGHLVRLGTCTRRLYAPPE